MRADFVDLYLLHSPDEGTPAAEICESMDRLVRTGKNALLGPVQPRCGIRGGVLRARPGGRHESAVRCRRLLHCIGLYAHTGRAVQNPKTGTRDVSGRARRGNWSDCVQPAGCGGVVAPDSRPIPDPRSRRCTRRWTRPPDNWASAGRRSASLGCWITREVTSVLAGPESTAHVDETLAGAALKLPAELRATLDAASERYGERMEEAHRLPQ